MRRAAGDGGFISRGSKDPCIGSSPATFGGKNIEPIEPIEPIKGIFGQYYRYHKAGAWGDLKEVKIGGTEMYWQGSNLVKSIDVPLAANDSPKVATARLSAQSLV